MTLGEFNATIEGRMDLLKYETAIQARAAMATVKGTREKKPNIRKLFHEVLGDSGPPKVDEGLGKILAQSRARVRKAQVAK